MQDTPSFTHLSDAQLTAEVARLAHQERVSTTELVASLEEFDRRRLYLAMGFTSLYAYCKEQLHLTEGAAHRRIEAARASRRVPAVLEMLRDGRLSLATAALIGPRLTPADANETLSQIEYRSKREVEAFIAQRHPQPPVPSVIRKLPQKASIVQATAPLPPAIADTPVLVLESVAAPAPAPVVAATPPSRRPVLAPLSEAHYKLQVTITTAAHDRLRQIQDLMRHTIPNGDPAVIVARALELLHADLLKKKAALVAKPRAAEGTGPASKGRLVPASVKRQVWVRDEGRCAFTSEDGRRCGERGSLEFHHVDPYAHGGKATVANIELRCRAHNGFEWQREVDQLFAGESHGACVAPRRRTLV